jgi:hypothetical protein
LFPALDVQLKLKVVRGKKKKSASSLAVGRNLESHHRQLDGFLFVGRDDRPEVLGALAYQGHGPAGHHRHTFPVRLDWGGCSFQFGRTSLLLTP